ncbi:MAG: zinc ribbon domain-containing protein [Smithellaceae bacterium]|jgi:putative FmdB family regulatory protein|nr:zinc ribbon domain-containing protein [Smithellaceae bacterium]MDD3258367.1 zinc ribbon domain-containing protein [Smithellaceae bacterium]MDD3849116.1 zinc ribbon domain-containing protein [Smithellaceae bacterium]HOG12688.1 zinc ribbon domain-containing protein [Smithellaceae bacterium]HPL10104.1 zinc ribbon domain-containing protein [Smithellaceae bacterium]
MPIYEYQCRKCGRQFEAFQGITEPDLKTCRFCRGKVQKMMSLSSFSLKGTGWYATDYKGKKPQAAKPKSTETTATESSSASSDASATVKGTSDD